MESKLYNLDVELREAESIVAQREETHSVVEERLNGLKEVLDRFREAKANLISNREIQLVLKRGQMEVAMHDMDPVAKECLIVTDSTINKLNDDILMLGEAKLVAMQESKEYRSGSLHLRYY